MLPVEDIIPQLRAALAGRTEAVLVAPPGAGKTTRVPLALMNEPWVAGRKIVMLEPRRLAARAAAARMAWSLGESVGQTVGFRVRLQSKISAATRVEVVTEGVFTRMIQDDPGLDGVALVIFDEFHERSLDADLGLALARDAQGLVREDLRLLVMSATLDGARISRLLADAPLIESQGRAYPVETRYLGRDPGGRLEPQVAKAVMRALADEPGGVLVFLPGQGEIRRVERLLSETLSRPDVDVAPLFGALGPVEQDRAIAPAPPGRRKVVLATSIAETSLTLEGVRVVIDAGVSRVPRFDPASGLTRLETVRVARAAADQRRGRAGRTEPGVCYRLWDEAETRGLVPFARPEILEADLSGLALDLARWGARDAAHLAFLDPPPAAAFAEARTLLTALGALDGDGALTAHGAALADMPLPPRLAHMVLRGAASGQEKHAARVAALLTEPGLGGRETDLRERLRAFDRDHSPRAEDARKLADRWARSARAETRLPPLSDAGLIGEAWPDRIAKARSGRGEFQLASGRGAFLDETDALARVPWLAVAELGGGGARDRILLAAPLDEAEVRIAFAHRLTREDRLERSAAGRLRAFQGLMLGRLMVEERLIERPDPELISAALLAEVRKAGLKSLDLGEATTALRIRVGFLRAEDQDGWPDFSDAALIGELEDWLAPLLIGAASLASLSDAQIEAALRGRLSWEAQQRLDRLAPARWEAPTGSRLTVDYAAEGGPRIEVRVQELFGLSEHPTIGPGRTPLILALLSPARRPIQITRDLPAFWRGSWRDVKAEMRGRYPRHPWPDDPAAAAPTTRVKPRG